MSERLPPRRFEGLHDEDQEIDPESLYSDEKLVPFDEELHSENGRPQNDLLTDSIGLANEASLAMSVVLNPVEIGILEKRYLSDEPETLEQIGKKIGLTAEGVRQIEIKALQKLKVYLNKEMSVSSEDAVKLKSLIAKISTHPIMQSGVFRRKSTKLDTGSKKEWPKNKFIKDFSDSTEAKEITRYLEGKDGLRSVISSMLIDVHNLLYEKKYLKKGGSIVKGYTLEVWERATRELFSLITDIDMVFDQKKQYSRENLIFLFDKSIEATEFIIRNSEPEDSKPYLEIYLDKFKKFRDAVMVG